MFTIRKFQQGEELQLRELFFQTIHKVNIGDYSLAQVNAWAPQDYDKSEWIAKINRLQPYVVEDKGIIVAYADIQPDGYIDHFFCHHAHQGKGIGKALLNKLLAVAEKEKMPRAYAHASKTAMPFFRHQGFTVVKEQQVEIRGEILTNYVVEKQFQYS